MTSLYVAPATQGRLSLPPVFRSVGSAAPLDGQRTAILSQLMYVELVAVEDVLVSCVDLVPCYYTLRGSKPLSRA